MHGSVSEWVAEVLTRGDVEGRTIAEAGGMDENGTVRPYLETLGPAAYIATDMRPGPGVDVVIDAADLPSLGSFGIVLSTEMLEHAQDWRAAMRGMIAAVEPGGLLVITTRSKGFPRHGYPDDWWRFSVPDMRLILERAGLDAEVVQADPETPGVFAKARKPDGWQWPPPPVHEDIDVYMMPGQRVAPGAIGMTWADFATEHGSA